MLINLQTVEDEDAVGSSKKDKNVSILEQELVFSHGDANNSGQFGHFSYSHAFAALLLKFL